MNGSFKNIPSKTPWSYTHMEAPLLPPKKKKGPGPRGSSGRLSLSLSTNELLTEPLHTQRNTN